MIPPGTKISTKVNVKSDAFKTNYSEMSALVDQLQQNLQESLKQGRKKDIARHISRGQLTARDRVELLLDQDSPFMELMPLAGLGQEDIPVGASVIIGIGVVCGTECLISANVPTLSGGSINEMSVVKTARAHTIAVENRLPSINLTQSAGANLSQQFRVFHPGGASFRQMAERSKAGLPTATIVFGSSTAGGAYTPGMSDYVIMVKNQAQVFLGGPPLVQMATGEITDAESLGGADMHSRKSGVSDYLAVDEIDAIRKCREFVASLNWKKEGILPSFQSIPPPMYPPDEILGVVPANIRIPFDAKEVIARLVDGSRFSDFKPLYGPNLITGWASIHGFPVGILANNNPIFPAEANKAVQFIQLCNMSNTPLLYLQNITGFMVGKKYEEDGIIKAGSRFINAVSNSQVPSITIVMGASYGAGNYAMNGRAYQPRFMFSWPNSKCSVMGPDQLTGVMDLIMKDAAKRKGIDVDNDETFKELAESRKEVFRSLVEKESDVWYTTSRMLDDGVIDPRDTRNVVGFCLNVIHGREVKGGNLYGISRM
ncbi:hypothetical protein MP638_002536 [Amoeboaphelidium occidentale]|nr:hypothetical protein MP638_002536 [Amoeboaphelidium occidentale]